MHVCLRTWPGARALPSSARYDKLRWASLCVTAARPRASRFASLLPANHPAQHRKPPGQASLAGRYRVMRATYVRTATGSRRTAGATTSICSGPHARSPPRSSASASPVYFFRPHNNVRFRPGPPLNEHLGVAIGYTAAGGSYLELSPDGLLVAAGLHHPATGQLQRVRAAIDDHRRASAFEGTVVSANAGGRKLDRLVLRNCSSALEKRERTSRVRQPTRKRRQGAA